MIKIHKRAEVVPLPSRAPEPVEPEFVPSSTAGMNEIVADLASAIKSIGEVSAQTQRSVVTLARAILEGQPEPVVEPKSKTLVAEVKRDEKGRMTHVVITVQ